MGRVKIPMEFRTDDRARRVTLCKRKKGLYKKAEELSKLCGVEVAVVIIGDTCKPSQMVSTGTANYTDIATTYRVLRDYSEQVTHAPPTTPPAALDGREALKLQQDKLEKQRRDIEELKRELKRVCPESKLLVELTEDENEVDDSEMGDATGDDDDEDEDGEAERSKKPAAAKALTSLAKFPATGFENIQLSRTMSGNQVAGEAKELKDLNELARQNSFELKRDTLLAREDSMQVNVNDLNLTRSISEEMKSV